MSRSGDLFGSPPPVARLAAPRSLPADVDPQRVECEWYDAARPRGDRLRLVWTARGADESAPALAMVGINPSSVGDLASDATCANFWAIARRAGFGRIVILNLFSAPATEPPDLLGYPGRPGYGERYVPIELRRVVAGGGRAVAAWGALSGSIPAESAYAGRGAELRTLLQARRDQLLAAMGEGFEWWCLGTNQDGSPRHPSRLGHSTEVVRWRT